MVSCRCGPKPLLYFDNVLTDSVANVAIVSFFLYKLLGPYIVSIINTIRLVHKNKNKALKKCVCLKIWSLGLFKIIQSQQRNEKNEY